MSRNTPNHFDQRDDYPRAFCIYNFVGIYFFLKYVQITLFQLNETIQGSLMILTNHYLSVQVQI